MCAGQILPINQNTALFALIGTTYGGDGVQTFALPDLRGRVPVHQGQGPGLSSKVIGQVAGTETVTLTTAQSPGHTHSLAATTSIGNESAPAGNLLAQSSVASAYIGDVPDTSLAPAVDHPDRRQPAARQHGTVPGGHLHHRPGRHLPVAELGGPPRD